MIKTIPDQHIRKAIFDLFNGTIVDGNTINVYDTYYASKGDELEAYVIMSTQSNDVQYQKCEDFWNSEILLEICTWYGGSANTGSRLLADQILDALRNALEVDLDLSGGGLEVIRQVITIPNDLTTQLVNGVLFRKFIRLELRIK